MGMTAFYGDPIPDKDCLALLQTVYDAGCRHFDTAEIYKTGNPFADGEEDLYNETVLGNFLKTVPRESYTVATKFFPSKYGSKCDYETVKKALEASLHRLGLAYVDLYYIHRIPSLEAAMEFARSCKKLKEEGLIRAMGVSEMKGSWVKKVHREVFPIDAVQQEWSLVTRNLEQDLVPICQEEGIVLVAYSPLCRGLMTSTMEMAPSDWRANLPRMSGQNFQKNTVMIRDVITSISQNYSCTPAEISLAWLFKKASQMGVTVLPIPGTTNVKHALSNIHSTQIDLNDDDMEVLEELALKVQGLRADEGYLNMSIEGQE